MSSGICIIMTEINTDISLITMNMMPVNVIIYDSSVVIEEPAQITFKKQIKLNSKMIIAANKSDIKGHFTAKVNALN